MSFFGKFSTAVRRLLHVLARPVRRGRGPGDIIIRSYRGYGTREEIFVIGRVLRQPGAARPARESQLRRDLRDVLRRFVRWGAGDREVVARIAGAEQRLTTDRHGYFRLHMAVQLPPSTRRWHEVQLALADDPAGETETTAEVYVPPEKAQCVIISDIDDTIMDTGVASKLTMLWRLFVQTAHARVAFPGIAALCRALHHGVPGDERNPMLYVSRAPWSIYEVLDEFFRLHRIPVGPVLFLREWGLTLQHPLPRRAKGHKRDLITNMLALYHDLPFVLIGDSGQRDPEIYAEVVAAHPGRVHAIFIRNVSRDAERERAIEALAKQVAKAGSSLVLAVETFAMAEHAAKHGLISAAACREVLAECEALEGAQRSGPTLVVEGRGRRETAEAVERGEVREKLARETGSDAPPNVVVEPGNERSQ
jgi:phosphatidate phosphatase APP1